MMLPGKQSRAIGELSQGHGLHPYKQWIYDVLVESALCQSGFCCWWTQAMGPCKCNFTKIAKRVFLAVVVLASPLGYAAAPAGKPGQSGTSTVARLNISVIVMPMLQTPMGVTPSATTHDAISYNFEATRREHRYEVRKLPVNRTSDSDLVHAAVLQTLTIVPE
jgi:hypothetical protein